MKSATPRLNKHKETVKGEGEAGKPVRGGGADDEY